MQRLLWLANLFEDDQMQIQVFKKISERINVSNCLVWMNEAIKLMRLTFFKDEMRELGHGIWVVE